MRPIQIISVLALASCSGRKPPPASTAELGSGGPLCLTEMPAPEPMWNPFGCPEVLCGNTARIYGAPIEALDEKGEGVQDFIAPFKLVRGKLTGAKGGCAGVANLGIGVRYGGFVGLEGDIVKCAGNDLLGARFVVEQVLPSPGKTRFATIRIDAIKDVAVWRREPEEPERVPSYDLVAEKGPELQPEHHLCKPAPWTLSIINLPFGEKTTHALVLQGESYSQAATVAHTGDNWFNIGCAGSGVAKLRLLGFDPMRKKEATGERQATLKMITAKYCGSRSWTRDGTVLVFVQQGGGTSGPPLPKPDGGDTVIGPIETRWGPEGALCISHSRLWSVGSKCAKENEAAFIERVRSDCHIPACDETAACESTASAGEGVWRTCTVNHVRHDL
jgi:hypothetical protein